MEDKILKAEEADGKKLYEELCEEWENNFPQTVQQLMHNEILKWMREGKKLGLVFKLAKENGTDKHPKRIPYVTVSAPGVIVHPKPCLNRQEIDWLFNYLLTGESDDSATHPKEWDRLPEKEGLDFERNLLLESLNRGGEGICYDGNGRKLHMNVRFPHGEICFSPYLKGYFWLEVQTALNK